jgi:hypothetical protein
VGYCAASALPSLDPFNWPEACPSTDLSGIVVKILVVDLQVLSGKEDDSEFSANGQSYNKDAVPKTTALLMATWTAPVI